MAYRPGPGLAHWEIATAKRIVFEQRNRHRLLAYWEFDDLVQESLLHWITVRNRLEQPDGGKPPVAYMSNVIRNKLLDLIRGVTADKRAGDPGALSLETPLLGEDEDLTLGDTLAEPERDAASLAGADVRDARIDLVRVLGRLTPAQQTLCRLLGEEGVTVKAAAERLAVHRATVYEEIKRIRRVFEAAGLGDYLSGGK